jgi:hypothetical protein
VIRVNQCCQTKGARGKRGERVRERESEGERERARDRERERESERQSERIRIRRTRKRSKNKVEPRGSEGKHCQVVLYKCKCSEVGK